MSAHSAPGDVNSLAAMLRDAGGTTAVCRYCHTAIGTVSGAGLTVFTDAGRFTVSTSGALVEQIEDLQISLAQGPCLEAIRTRRPVQVDDLADVAATVRWPAFAAQARRYGVRAIFAYPVLVADRAVAALDLCRTSPGPLSNAEADQATEYAAAAAVLLTEDAQAGATSRGGASVPAEAARTQQAAGMVMVQMRSNPAGAMHRLRSHAFDQNRTLIDVVDDVLTGRLRFDATSRP